MMVSINVREFPDDLHRKVKAQAALEGIPLKELVVKALTEYLQKAERSKKSKRG